MTSTRFSMVAIALLFIAPITAYAATVNYSVADATAQPGMLMSLTTNPGVVEPATNKNAGMLVGVYSEEVTVDQQEGQITVKNDGVATALVSTLHGDIKVGDRITPSSLAGTGSKLKGSGWVVGVAQASLDAGTKDTISSQVTDSAGKKHRVYLANIPIIVRPTFYTEPVKVSTELSVVPDNIQKVADTLAGKRASLLGLMLGFILLLAGLVLAGITAYGAAKGTIMAVSRQPLAKSYLTKKMLQSISLAFGILAASIISALVILRVL